MARMCVVRRRNARTGAIIARRQKYLASLSPEVRALMSEVNAQSANDFADLVRRIIPLGDPADGNLVDTIEVAKSERYETASTTSIGSTELPYPMHLEVGHKAPDGSHVEGKRYWFPARNVIRRRRRAAIAAANRKAIAKLGG